MLLRVSLERRLYLPRSQGKGSPPTEDHRARFYETYNQEAEDYDREFVKRYEGDLNTTLILVSPVRCSDSHLLTSATGRFVLRRDFRLHH